MSRHLACVVLFAVMAVAACSGTNPMPGAIDSSTAGQGGGQGDAAASSVDLNPSDRGPSSSSSDVATIDVGLCQADLDCPLGNPCVVGKTICVVGATLCQAKTNVADGQPCGTERVCTGGACGACKAGAACAAAPCKMGTMSCTSGSACREIGNAPDGTACGAGMTCQAGVCAACVAGGTCQLATDPCHKGTQQCTAAGVTCVSTAVPQPDGTPCSTGACLAGRCNGCRAGVSCNIASSCKQGTTSCATGAPVCVEGANKPDGAACGTNQVCAGGACVACTGGAPCMPATTCHQGLTDCSNGSPICKDTGFVSPDGTPCGQDRYCVGGSCTACVGGGACTPPDPCQTGTYACVGGQRQCVASGSAAAGTCGVTTMGTCTDGACQCPAGTGFWNGDCAVCPAFAGKAFLVNADPGAGHDNQCCGRTQVHGFGGPCLTLTQALRNAAGMTAAEIDFQGDKQGNASPGERYPLVLGPGLSLQPTADTCVPGVAGTDILHVDQGPSPVVLNRRGAPTKLTLGTTCAGVASGAATGLVVAEGAEVQIGNLIITKTATGARTAGRIAGTLSGGTMTITDVSGDGVTCRAGDGVGSHAAFDMGFNQVGLFTARVGGRAVYLSQGCTFKADVRLGSDVPCPSPKLDGQGLVADGNATASLEGSIQCMRGNGIALLANPALSINRPSVATMVTCDPTFNLLCMPVIQHNGCAGGYAEAGRLVFGSARILHNHWGVHQKSRVPSSDPGAAQIQIGATAPPQLACNTRNEPGDCCTSTDCLPGADVFNEGGLVLQADHSAWEDSPVTLCNCDAALTSCACNTGATVPPDGIDILNAPGAQTTITNFSRLMPSISCQ